MFIFKERNSVFCRKKLSQIWEWYHNQFQSLKKPPPTPMDILGVLVCDVIL